MQSQSSVEINFQDAIKFLLSAIDQHDAQLIIFPENFLCIGSTDYAEIIQEIDFCITELTKYAKQYSVYLLLGSVPVLDGKNKYLSRSILINSAGLIVGSYDKIHLFDVEVGDSQGSYKESDNFSAGSSHCSLPVNSNCLGLSICYDLRFPELYQLLRKDGAQMIAVPSAFTYKTGEAHWEVLLRARAIENQCYILAPNQCGTHHIEKNGQSRETWGHSMVVDPWGEILCSLKHSPGVCSASLDFDYLNKIRQSMNLLGHKRL